MASQQKNNIEHNSNDNKRPYNEVEYENREQFDDRTMDELTRTTNILKKQNTGSFDQNKFNQQILTMMQTITQQFNSFRTEITNQFQVNNVNNNIILIKDSEPNEEKDYHLYVTLDENRSLTTLEATLLSAPELTNVRFKKVLKPQNKNFAIIYVKSSEELDVLIEYLTSKKIDYKKEAPDLKFSSKYLITHLPSTLREENLIEKLLERDNRLLKREEIKLLKFKSTTHSSYSILGYLGETSTKIKQDPVHYIGLREYELTPYTELSICDNCSDYHNTKFCRQTTKACGVCGKEHPNSKIKKCPGPPNCINCQRRNLTKTTHTAFSITCPARKLEMQKIIQKRGH